MMREDSGGAPQEHRGETATAGASYSVEGLNKTFPGVVALDDVSLEVRKGEIHGIVGKNGAGKSVLMNVLAGLLPATSGEIYIEEQPVNVRRYNVPRAHELGVELVPQEPTFAPDLSVQDNLFLGSGFSGALGFVERAQLLERVREVIDRLGIEARPEWPMSRLSVEDQQLLAFGKALFIDRARIILLDEITATLPRERKTRFLEFLRGEVERSPELSFTLISHHITEILEFCERVTVMRDGEAIGPLNVGEINKTELADMITGGDTSEGVSHISEGAANREDQPILLDVRGLTSPGNFEDISFQLRGGQVLGVAGLAESSGKDALLPALMGIAPVTEGTVELKGSSIKASSPRQALRQGLAYLPKKREEEGVITGGSVRDNLLVNVYERLRNFLGAVKHAESYRIARKNLEDFGIKARSVESRIDTLSGGNRQKVMLARQMNASPSVLLLDEPTRGVDIGAKTEIMRLIRESLTDERAVIVTSESEEELVELCEQILVISHGRLIKTLSRGEERFTPTEVYRLAQGVDSEPGSGASA